MEFLQAASICLALTNDCSAAVKAPCNVITIVSAFRNTVSHLRACPDRRRSMRLAAREIWSAMVDLGFLIQNPLVATVIRHREKKKPACSKPWGFQDAGYS